MSKVVERPMKLGILLAFYGTSSTQSDRSLRLFKDRIEKVFGVPVRMAFTSEALRKRLAHAKTKSDSVFKALNRMYFDKYTHVIVQSLHLVPGQEFEDFLEDIELFQKDYTMRVYTGKSLLYNEMEVQNLANTILTLVPTSMKEKDGLIFMGHGSVHEAQRYYDLLDMEISKINPFVRVACMKCGVTLDSILEDWKDTSHQESKTIELNIQHFENFERAEQAEHFEQAEQTTEQSLKLKIQQGTTIHLLPLLVAIGSHALNDMAGDDANSWKSQIEKAGYTCIPHLHGLAESKDLQDIWISRIKDCYTEFKLGCIF